MVPQHIQEYLSCDSMANSDDDVKRKHCVTSTWVLNAISIINFLEHKVFLSSVNLPIVHSSYYYDGSPIGEVVCVPDIIDALENPNGLSLWKDDNFLSNYVIPWQ